MSHHTRSVQVRLQIRRSSRLCGVYGTSTVVYFTGVWWIPLSIGDCSLCRVCLLNQWRIFLNLYKSYKVFFLIPSWSLLLGFNLL